MKRILESNACSFGLGSNVNLRLYSHALAVQLQLTARRPPARVPGTGIARIGQQWGAPPGPWPPALVATAPLPAARAPPAHTRRFRTMIKMIDRLICCYVDATSICLRTVSSSSCSFWSIDSHAVYQTPNTRTVKHTRQIRTHPFSCALCVIEFLQSSFRISDAANQQTQPQTHINRGKQPARTCL